jgi:hypothetical protein
MMLDKALRAITDNPDFLTQHLYIVEGLQRSGLLAYLRVAGLSYLNLPYKDATESALNAARAQGWQMCLDTILTFKEQVYGPEIDTTDKTVPRPDFGSIDRAVDRGDLTKEEADAIRNDTKPDYTTYIRSDKPDAASF